MAFFLPEFLFSFETSHAALLLRMTNDKNPNYNDDPFANPGEPKRGQCVLHRNVWFKPTDFPIDALKDSAQAFGVNQTALKALCDRLDTKSLFIKGLTANDLSPLANIKNLEELNITWAHKFDNVSVLKDLPNLQSLTISDTKRWQDLSQLAGAEITHLDVSGGMWNDNTFESLAPLADLPNLETLVLNAVKAKEGGLKPLAQCKSLKRLSLSYKFDTEDYAYLSVKLPDVDCDAFAPYVSWDHTPDDEVLVVGKRKPFLNRKKDEQRLAKYIADFDKLQMKFKV